MPWVRPETIARVVEGLRRGASIAAPSRLGVRGHPVGFARDCYAELIALSGDAGAKAVLEAQRVALFDTEDDGILRDVDTRADLER
jgi:molybdenum cofactor cytidylyltransferase